MRRLSVLAVALSAILLGGAQQCGVSAETLSAFCVKHADNPQCVAASDFCVKHPGNPQCQPLAGTGGIASTGGTVGTGGATSEGTPSAGGVTSTGGVASEGGTTSTGGVTATGGTTVPAYTPYCLPLDGYAIVDNGCVGPYVTDTAVVTHNMFTGLLVGLKAGMFLKAEGSTQVYAIVQISPDLGVPLKKTLTDPDHLLSWSNATDMFPIGYAYGCNPDCMAIQPPSANGCSRVRQVTQNILDLIETVTMPLPYRGNSVILVYDGPDMLMQPATAPEWMMRRGDMFIGDFFRGNYVDSWRRLRRITQETAVASFPNVTEGIKRVVDADFMLRFYNKWLANDVTGIFDHASMCAASGDVAYDFRYLYPQPL